MEYVKWVKEKRRGNLLLQEWRSDALETFCTSVVLQIAKQLGINRKIMPIRVYVVVKHRCCGVAALLLVPVSTEGFINVNRKQKYKRRTSECTSSGLDLNNTSY
jgi:hypothetical protein